MLHHTPADHSRFSKKKPAAPVSALKILGAVYTAMGVLFVGLGILIPALTQDPEMTLFLFIFGGVGGVFLILGIVFLAIIAGRRRKMKQLVEEGRFLWGQIVQCQSNYAVRINGRHPSIALVRYTDAQGRNHLFRSESLNLLTADGLIGKQVKVYYRDTTYRHYYVDMGGVLPQYIMH